MVKKIIYVILIGVFIFIVARNYYKKQELKRDYKVGTAKIVDYKMSYRGGLNITYIFIVKGKQYKSMAGQPDISGKNGDAFMNKYFPVVYNFNNPTNNELLMRPQEFKKYDMPFPDSLNWVLRYL